MEEIFTGLFFVIAIIIAFMFGVKKSKFISQAKEKNWRPIQGKPNYVEIYDSNKWKKIKLPKDKDGKQIKNNEVKEIEISNKGEMNVKIIKGVTDRRNIADNRDGSALGI